MSAYGKLRELYQAWLTEECLPNEAPETLLLCGGRGDANCITLPNGDCVSTLSCMHTMEVELFTKEKLLLSPAQQKALFQWIKDFAVVDDAGSQGKHHG